jgi:hypothetical protein
MPDPKAEVDEETWYEMGVKAVATASTYLGDGFDTLHR